MKKDRFVDEITDILDEIQGTLFDRAQTNLQANTVTIDGSEEFYDFFTPENQKQPEIHGGFALSHWCGAESCERKIKDDLSVSIRCIPFDGENESGACVCCGQASQQRVVYAKAY